MPALPTTDGAYIQWAVVAGSGGYIIGIAEGPGQPALQRLQTYSDGANSVSVHGLMQCHQYYYQVVTRSDWRLVEDGYFTTVRPATNLNVIVHADLTVSFSWTTACGSLWNDQYVDVGTSPGASDIISANVGPGAAWYDLPISLPPGTYWVRVNNKFGYTWFPSVNKSFIITAPTRRLTVSVSPAGSGTTSPSGTTFWDLNTPVTVSASPNSGYRFDHWSGSVTGTDPVITVIMDSNKSITANFVALPARTPATNLTCSSS